MKKTIFLTATLVANLFISCGNDDSDETNNIAPEAVTLSIVDETDHIGIDFVWTEAIDADGDAVTYDFYANGNVLAENLTSLNYSWIIENVEEFTYPVTFKVVSKDSNGGETDSNEIIKEDPTDAIVGTWTFTSVIYNGESLDISDCIQQGNLVFTLEGVLTDNFYSELDNECELESIEGTWVNNGDSTYTGTFTDDVETYTIDFTLTEDDLRIIDTSEDAIAIYTK